MNHVTASFFVWCRRYITLPLLVAGAYGVFVVFLNDNSYARSAALATQIRELKAEIKENDDTMRHYLRLVESLRTDPAELERTVREQYHMQRPDEDVYVTE